MRLLKTLLMYSLLYLILTNQVFSYQNDVLRINGYSSFEIEKQTSDQGSGDKNFSFDADLFDLVFNFIPTKKVRVSADVTWEHGSATEDGKGNVAVEYGFAEYTISDSFKFRAGKFLIPFGIFNEIHTSKPSYLSVKEAASTNKTERTAAGGYRFFPRWGTGVGLKGHFTLAQYEGDYDLLITNGEGADNDFEEDHGPGKAYTFRSRVGLGDNWQLGVSFYNDSNSNVLTIDDVLSYGFQSEYENGSFHLIFEIVKGEKETLNPTTGNREEIRQVGWFIQIAYEYEDSGLTPYFRFEEVDPNSNIGNDTGRDIILGLNIKVDEAYTIKIEDNYFKGLDYNEIKAAIAVGF